LNANKKLYIYIWKRVEEYNNLIMKTFDNVSH
jgi:hypothetical protein